MSVSETKKTAPKSLNIVVIGASAGGLEALQDFLSYLPELENTAIIIAQHLSPTHKSLLVQLLSKQTQLEVYEAKSHATLLSNTVYITPPDKEIRIVDGDIILKKPALSIGPKPSVDLLFESLANLKKQKVIAVILSGTGSDGSKGIASLNGANFLKIAQDPETAKYNGMPQSAILSGAIDLIQAPENMGEEILLFINDPEYLNKLATTKANNPNEVFESILKILSIKTGTDFSGYKKATLMRRLEKRMQMLKLIDNEKYLTYLNNTPSEIQELYNMMLIGVTHFFRDQEAFDALEIFLNKALKSKKEKDTLRIWVPGCSTGEEAYSIAIMVDRLMVKNEKELNIQIFATDIDDRAIHHARKASYAAICVNHLPDEIKSTYFIRNGKEFEITKNIRAKVLFSKHNIIQSPPFLGVDLISCRNLFIYFNASLQQQILPIFHYAIKNDGYLFLGKAETVGNFTDLFTAVDSKNKIYRRNKSLNMHAIKFSPFKSLVFSNKNTKIKTIDHEISLTDRVKETLFNTYENPYVIINSKFDIQEVFGDVRLFLSLPP